ncbi:MAG: hypothetical protein IT553_03195 [Sphingomonadaceae bacterium]|nr:hypothetical protein [Sphingomonadaceae bacterium]
MAQSGYFFADLVREICRDSGSGALALAGALPGHRAFADIVPVSTPFAYIIAGVRRPEQWEVGVGQLAADGRLQRDQIRASSANGAKVDFDNGLKSVALTVDAAWFAAADAAGADGGGDDVPPHAHAIAEVAGLQAALDGKLAANLVSPFALSILDDGDATAARATLSALGQGDILLAADGSVGAPGVAFAADMNSGLYRSGSDALRITTGGVSRIAVNADGRIGMGTQAPQRRLQIYDAAGASLALATDDRNDGFFVTAAMGMSAGSGKGWLGTLSAHPLQLGTNNGVSAVLETSGVLRSGADNAVSLGSAGNRWSVVYAGTGTINTSDQRDKKWRGGLTDAERAAARDIIAEIGMFQWHGAVADKGDAARLHIGVRAQAVWGIMARHGLVDPIGADGQPTGTCPYAFLCYDKLDADADADAGADGAGAAGYRYGVRNDQLAQFLIAGVLA